MFGIPIEFEGVEEEVIEELVRGRQAKDVMALMKARQEQELVAMEQQRLGKLRALNGLGRATMAVTPTAYHYWGQRFGTYDCWKDEQFRKEMQRDNESVRVQSGGTRTVTIGGAEFGEGKSRTRDEDEGRGRTRSSGGEGTVITVGSGERRFHKVYGEKTRTRTKDDYEDEG